MKSTASSPPTCRRGYANSTGPSTEVHDHVGRVHFSGKVGRGGETVEYHSRFGRRISFHKPAMGVKLDELCTSWMIPDIAVSLSSGKVKLHDVYMLIIFPYVSWNKYVGSLLDPKVLSSCKFTFTSPPLNTFINAPGGNSLDLSLRFRIDKNISFGRGYSLLSFQSHIIPSGHASVLSHVKHSQNISLEPSAGFLD